MLTAFCFILAWMVFVVTNGVVVEVGKGRLETLWMSSFALGGLAFVVCFSWLAAAITGTQYLGESLFPTFVVGIVLTLIGIGTYKRFQNLYGKTPSS